MNISTLIQSISAALSATMASLTPLPGLLMLCTSSRRPGFSSILASAKIYADMEYANNENDEIVKAFVYNVVQRIKQNIQDDGVCFVAIPPGGINLSLAGGNAGGPVSLTGSNVNYVFTWAIIR